MDPGSGIVREVVEVAPVNKLPTTEGYFFKSHESCEVKALLFVTALQFTSISLVYTSSRFPQLDSIQTFAMPPMAIEEDIRRVKAIVVKTFIPQTCRAGICSDNGHNYKLTVEDVSVPTPGQS